MKSILYAGAFLMAGACIYGFVDYKKTSRSKEFQSLYKEEKKVVATESPLENRNSAAGTQNGTVNKKKLPEKESVYTKTESATVREKIIGKRTIKKEEKELDYRLFSRARPVKFEKSVVLEENDLKAEEVKVPEE